MKTKWKILLGILTGLLLIPLICWIEHKRAEVAPAHHREKLLQAHAAKPLAELAQALGSSPRKHHEFMRVCAQLPDIGNPKAAMLLLPSGPARVGHRFPTRAWTEIEQTMQAIEPIMAGLISLTAQQAHWDPGVTQTNGISPTQAYSRARGWMMRYVLVALKNDHREAALSGILTCLRLDQSDWLDPQASHTGALTILWEALQSDLFIDDDLQRMSEVLQHISPGQKQFLTYAVKIARIQRNFATAVKVRTDPFITPQPDPWSSISKQLLSSPREGWRKLGERIDWHQRGWYGIYHEEIFHLDSILNDWTAWHHGLETKAITNGIALAERLHREHNPPSSVPTSALSRRDADFPTFLEFMSMRHCLRELMQTAIAVKRFHLAHGSPPANLLELVPSYLPVAPRDPMDGRTLRYRRDKLGRYEIYSIGFDCHDDDGNGAAPANTTFGLEPIRARDWLWPRPATDAELRAAGML